VVLDGPSNDRPLRNPDIAVPLEAGTDRFGQRRPAANWAALGPSERDGLVALMAELSLRAVRDGSREKQFGEEHDLHIEDPR
jgi:hypothetical protein